MRPTEGLQPRRRTTTDQTANGPPAVTCERAVASAEARLRAVAYLPVSLSATSLALSLIFSTPSLIAEDA